MAQIEDEFQSLLGGHTEEELLDWHMREWRSHPIGMLSWEKLDREHYYGRLGDMRFAQVTYEYHGDSGAWWGATFCDCLIGHFDSAEHAKVACEEHAAYMRFSYRPPTLYCDGMITVK
jgi:hypothetical protein